MFKSTFNSFAEYVLSLAHFLNLVEICATESCYFSTSFLCFFRIFISFFSLGYFKNIFEQYVSVILDIRT